MRWPACETVLSRAAQLTAQSAVNVHKSVVQQVHSGRVHENRKLYAFLRVQENIHSIENVYIMHEHVPFGRFRKKIICKLATLKCNVLRLSNNNN